MTKFKHVYDRIAELKSDYSTQVNTQFDQIIKVLFEEFPKLRKLKFSFISEYDDNDYYNVLHIFQINEIERLTWYNGKLEYDNIDKVNLFDEFSKKEYEEIYSFLKENIDEKLWVECNSDNSRYFSQEIRSIPQ